MNNSAFLLPHSAFQDAKIVFSPEFPEVSQKMLRTMQQASSGLEKIVTESVRRAPQADAPALAWPMACGSAVAERTRAVGFAEGILQVEVADKGWRAELQALAPQYLAILNRYVGNRVQRIEFVVRAG